MTRTTALVVAAGSGSRSGGDRPKQYAHIAGKAVLAHAVDALAAHPAIDRIQVVIGAGQEDDYRAAIGARELPPPIVGGAVRRASVANGLAAVEGDHVLVHDAARPFLPGAVIDRLLAALGANDGAVPVLPVVDTLAEVGATLGPVVPRAGLARVQTPQAFRTEALRRAHAAWNDAAEATDDAQMARAAGYRIAAVEGAASLEKLTYAEDFVAAERRLESRLVARTALGFDVHGFAPGDGLWLGGVRIAHDRALAGHSDADVALHALTDALLGTIGAGDIGSHFPPSDPQWRGADSSRFLTHARDLVAAAGGRIDHVDLTIVCEAPKVGPHRDAIRARVAALLGLKATRVSVKATTTERLGFTGRGEGIAAQAAATVRVPGGDRMRRIALTLAMAALPTVATAQAPRCITQDEAAALVTFALPSLVDGLADRCGAELPPGAYLAANSRALSEHYQPDADAAWPSARRTIAGFFGQLLGQPMPAEMNSDVLRVLVAPLIGRLLAKQVSTADCVTANAAITAAAPLPGRNVGKLAALAATIADRKDKGIAGVLHICRPPSRP